MPVPMPSDDVVDLNPPTAEKSAANAAGVLSATRTADGNTEFQRLLIEATFEAMTGHRIDTANLPVVSAREAAETLRSRAEPFRMRMVHMMVLSALVLRPLPADVAERVAAFSREMGIDDDLLRAVRQFADSDHALAAVDFERNGYTATWSDEQTAALHTTAPVRGWDANEDDPMLAEAWADLGDRPSGTLGRQGFGATI